MTPETPYMTAAEVAKYVRLEGENAEQTVLIWVKKGKLKAHKFNSRVIRFLKADVDKMGGH